ncbi:MAG: transposase [Chloroflexi bacterium]|nr:transposase [Chloroflexota bacterium]
MEISKARGERAIRRSRRLARRLLFDGQTVRGARGGKTVHEKGGRGGPTNGAKRSIVIEILGLPLAVSVESARPHDVSAGRRLLDTTLPALGTVKAIVSDRGYRGLDKMAASKGVSGLTSRHLRRAPSASSRSRRSTASSRPSRAWAAGGGCRPATSARLRAPEPGSTSPSSPTSSRASGSSLPERRQVPGSLTPMPRWTRVRP